MCGSIMTDPFITSEPKCLVSMARAFCAILRNCWPRFRGTSYANEALRIITICWLNVHGSNQGDLAILDSNLAEELQMAAAVVLAILDPAEAEGDDAVVRLIAHEPQLKGLFPAATDRTVCQS
jgi:hypothetical protein